MASFSYKAFDAMGGKCDGIIEAPTIEAAHLQLEKEGLLPYELKAQQTAREGIRLFEEQVSLADLEFVTSELSLLLATGIRIDRGLDIIRKTKAKPVLAKLLTDLSQSLKKGNSLSQACRAHPKVFDSLYCNLIELGEASGDLAGTFAGLSQDLKFKRDLRKKIVSAITYPIVIFFVCVLSILFIFNVIIPKMADMFANIEQLPWYTQAMLGTSAWFNQNQSLLLAGLIAAVGGVFLLSKNERVIAWWHRAVLQLPIFGTAVKTVERIRFNTGLSLMLKAGVAIDKALTLATGNIRNQQLFAELEVARKKIKRGNQLTPSLQQSSLYPSFYISLLEVGEESGKLETVFDEIASRSKQDFETWTDRITSLLEPIMILFMGVFVGGVVVVMMLSMISLNDVGF
ncbi:type II secretion system F family protein [Pseudoalteromonas sp. J010]|uniref:type II secretion system F family protein n=1 Tax=Pseudoalteromonas sp. J010 TaxID=998465 RepID=UPI000F64708A|nr:type II secretion system F family protein [Pseudoalteromonas sp. J010]RRS10084.1 type II secretion system F family protein [Pseudoalteromonas sp. J010]